MPNLTSAYSVAEKAGGSPVELYSFARGSFIWRYTSNNKEVVVDETELSYIPAKIQRGELQRKDETGAQRVEVTFGRKLGILTSLRDGTTLPMIASIHRYHKGSGDLPALLIWGSVGATSLDGSVAKCNIVSSEAQLASPIPRVLITSQCQLGVYTARCGINALEWAFDTTITSFSRSLVEVDSVDGHDDTYYSNGILQIGDSFIHIESQVGTTLKIFGSLPDSAAVDNEVRIFKGCDKTLDSCISFDNVYNMLAFPYLPQTNPLLIRSGS